MTKKEEKEFMKHKIPKTCVEDFHTEQDLKYRYAFYLSDKTVGHFYKVLFPNARKLVYGCYDLWVDTDFVLSDKPERVFLHTMEKNSKGEEVLKSKNLGNNLKYSNLKNLIKSPMDAIYYEYESSFEKDLITNELIVKTDFVLSRSGDKQHWCFVNWELEEDGETIRIHTDSRLFE